MYDYKAYDYKNKVANSAKVGTRSFALGDGWVFGINSF
jgi:hypothetical protein